MPLVLGGAAAVLVVGVSLLLFTSGLDDDAASPGEAIAPPPVEEVVTRVGDAAPPPRPEDPGPAPIEEYVTDVTAPAAPTPASGAGPDAGSPVEQPEVSLAAPASTLPAARATTEPAGRPVLTLQPEQVDLETPRVAGNRNPAPAPTLPLQTQPAAKRPPMRQPQLTQPQAAPPPPTTRALPPASRGSFEPGQTRLTSGRAASGPKGFDMTGLEAQRSTEFLGSIEFEVQPPQPRPGEPFEVRIYLLNAGEKDVKIRSLTLTTQNDAGRETTEVHPLVDSLDEGGRALLYTFSSTWGAGSWGLRAEVLTSRNEKASNFVRWQPAS